MRLGDRGRKGEPETGTAACPGSISAAEALEGVGQEVRWQARPFVTDVELDPAVVLDCIETDRARSVAECVVHQVAERLLEAEPVSVEDDRIGFCLDRAPSRVRPGSKRLADGVEELIGADRSAAEWQAPVVGLRENEEILGETDEPFGLGCCRADRLFELRLGSGLPEGELELAPEQRVGCSELVARVGDETPIARSRRASISFSVSARRAISSRAGPAGRRRPGSEPEIAAASTRISSTGRSAAPASQ